MNVGIILAHAMSAQALTLPSLPRLTPPEALVASHGFSESANWLVPGHVLVGANPTKGRGAALDRVMSICDVGCSTFVSLQAELPSFDSDQFPASEENYAIDVRSIKGTEAQFVHLPIEDLKTASSVQWLVQNAYALGDRVLSGEVLYLHCFAGRGRTGLVAACLLGVLYNGMQGEEALERVSAYYRTRSAFAGNSRAQDGQSPETEPQRQQVRDFFAGGW